MTQLTARWWMRRVSLSKWPFRLRRLVTRHLPFPDREVNWIRRLYEKGVAGFYDVVLSSQGWRVHPGTVLHWPKAGMSPRIDQILPTMRTDIVLDHVDTDRRIVIDTKFKLGFIWWLVSK